MIQMSLIFNFNGKNNFVQPDWLFVRSKLVFGPTNDQLIDKNYLQASNAIIFIIFSVWRVCKSYRHPRGGGMGVLPYMGYINIGKCHCKGYMYGFQAVYSRIGYMYINQSVWV